MRSINKVKIFNSENEAKEKGLGGTLASRKRFATQLKSPPARISYAARGKLGLMQKLKSDAKIFAGYSSVDYGIVADRFETYKGKDRNKILAIEINFYRNKEKI